MIQPWDRMSQLGQTEKNSMRANVFRFDPESGPCPVRSALRICAKGDIIGAQAPSLLFSGKRRRVSAIDNGRHRVDRATPDELQLI